jgi:hypothetical protein
VTTAFYAYEMAVNAFLRGAFGMTPWWFQLISNILFEVELLFILGYALLFRRAKANRKKYYSDVDGWFAKAGAAKRGLADILRQGFWQKKKP